MCAPLTGATARIQATSAPPSAIWTILRMDRREAGQATVCDAGSGGFAPLIESEMRIIRDLGRFASPRPR